VKKRTRADRHAQALHALNCAVACMVAWPPSKKHLGGAIYFTTLALYRMAQTDPDGAAAKCAESYLEQARRSPGTITVSTEEGP
jgi:hypothetical protein